jgi:hypothetical protein
MFGLYVACGNTSHSYLFSKSVTTFSRCERALSCKMSGPSPSKSGWVDFCTFLCAISASSHDNTLLSQLFHMELLSVMMIPRWSYANIIICLICDCACRIFLGRGKAGLLHSFDCDFNCGPKSLTHVSSIVKIRYKNAWPSALNLCFSNDAVTKRYCFCSAVKQWGTHRAQIFLFCKSFVKIRNIYVDETPVACDISSHVARRFSAGKSATSFTLRSSVDVFGLPDLGSSLMVTRPLRKWVTQRETVLRSAVCSLQTVLRSAVCSPQT